MQTLSARPTVRRLDADQVFRDPIPTTIPWRLSHAAFPAHSDKTYYLSQMTDTRSPEQRSRIMRSVKSKHTKPELAVRRIVRSLGYGYRIHRKDLPGKPDLAFIGRKKAIFVHGCFWHGHDCPKGRLPKSRQGFWVDKIEKNQQRDRRAVEALTNNGWQTLTIWQCELRDSDAAREKISTFLASNS